MTHAAVTLESAVPLLPALGQRHQRPLLPEDEAIGGILEGATMPTKDITQQLSDSKNMTTSHIKSMARIAVLFILAWTAFVCIFGEIDDDTSHWLSAFLLSKAIGVAAILMLRHLLRIWKGSDPWISRYIRSQQPRWTYNRYIR